MVPMADGSRPVRDKPGVMDSRVIMRPSDKEKIQTSISAMTAVGKLEVILPLGLSYGYRPGHQVHKILHMTYLLLLCGSVWIFLILAFRDIAIFTGIE